MNRLRREELPRGGFAGLKETRLVMGEKVFGTHVDPGVWNGFGSFVYLADARFKPKGETRLHSHREVDVISIMVEGQIRHEGSLEHGTQLKAGDVQVQRAGGEGFSHNEVNPDEKENRMIQIWMTPEKAGEPADYRTYHAASGTLTQVYGGPSGQSQTFPSQTILDVGVLQPGGEVRREGEYLAYIMTGEGSVGDQKVQEGDLLRGNGVTFHADKASLILIVHLLRT